MKNIGEIYEKYGNIVYKYVFCLTGNRETAEEITQETFLVATKNIEKFRGECKLSTWLCQISKYIWYKEVKKEKVNETCSMDIIQESICNRISIEEEICNKEERVKIFKIIQTFDENTKNVMYLRIFGNFEYKEIAEIMNKTPNWARITFFRGKQKLKEEMKNEIEL